MHHNTTYRKLRVLRRLGRRSEAIYKVEHYLLALCLFTFPSVFLLPMMRCGLPGAD
jgi:hypothetical protein